MTSSSLPLTDHPSPDSIVAWRPDGPVSRDQFLADVAQLAARFPPGGHVLNVCQDRYHFLVGLSAAAVSGRVSLLPPQPHRRNRRPSERRHPRPGLPP